jgi:hypothetical protein
MFPDSQNHVGGCLTKGVIDNFLNKNMPPQATCCEDGLFALTSFVNCAYGTIDLRRFRGAIC